MKTSRTVALFIGVCCLALTACDRGADTPDKSAEAAQRQTPAAAPVADQPPVALPAALAEIEAQAETTDAIEGESTVGDATFRYRAFADGSGSLFFVDEDVMTGDYGATRDRYYFVDGQLAYFYREGSQLVAMPPDPPGLGDVVIFMAFNADGTVDAKEKRLKGRQADMEKYEVTAVVRRADELQQTAAFALSEPLGENEYAGYLVFNGPLSTFQPCRESVIYWVSGDDDVVASLRDAYDAKLGDAAGEAAYARLVGAIGDPIREGPASHYPAVFRVQEQTALARRADRDCP